MEGTEIPVAPWEKRVWKDTLGGSRLRGFGGYAFPPSKARLGREMDGDWRGRKEREGFLWRWEHTVPGHWRTRAFLSRRTHGVFVPTSPPVRLPCITATRASPLLVVVAGAGMGSFLCLPFFSPPGQRYVGVSRSPLLLLNPPQNGRGYPLDCLRQ